MYIRRSIEKTIKKLSKFFPCLAIYGLRQVEKSTAVSQLFDGKIPTVTLDDTNDRSLANSNSKLFFIFDRHFFVKETIIPIGIQNDYFPLPFQ